tara:strand:+ start:1482 stop:2225 length:744 start_codon:yes stop_codon:yes gene_type:complete
MEFVKLPYQIEDNLRQLESHLIHGNKEEQKEARLLLKRGTCYVCYEKENEIRFAPSRFVGYINNTLNKHNLGKDTGVVHGSYTNAAINKAFKTSLIINEVLNEQLIIYCNSFGVNVDNKNHKFWMHNSVSKFKKLIKKKKGYKEGSISYRMHRKRERNRKLVKDAKDAFREKHGKLFCEACTFDFHKKYGERGLDYIEAHHTIPISQMEPNEKTNIEDLVMLCANCHRMIHRGEDGEELNTFKELIQ